MKRRYLVIALVSLIVISSCATYFWVNMTSQDAYKNSLFVERGVNNGYAEVHSLYQSL